MALRLRQGLSSDRTSITPASGELIYTTDTKYVYVGDGVTAGGNLISGAVPTSLDGLSDVVITSPTNGQVLKFDGTNWINGTDNTGGGGGSMTSWNLYLDDSTSVTVGDGDVITLASGGSINITLDEITNTVTLDTPFFVNSGIQGQLAYYDVTGSNITGTPPDLVYDEANQILYVETIHPNLLLTDNPTMAFINTDNGGFSIGGNLNGTEYSGRILINDTATILDDPVNPFHTLIRTVHDEAATRSMTFARARGAVGAEDALQVGDQLGGILFSAFDGTEYTLSAVIGSNVEQPITTPGIVPSNLFFQTVDNTGTLQPAIYCDSEQAVTLFKAYRSFPFAVDVSSSNVTLIRRQLAGNYLVVIGTPPSPRDVLIPNASIDVAGTRLVVRNITAQNVVLKDTSGNPIATITPGTHTEIIYSDADIYQLY